MALNIHVPWIDMLSLEVFKKMLLVLNR